jgi:hypothetical protein
MKTNRRFFAAALIGLLIASCAHRPDTRIADLTREYVAGRISYRRYHDLCYAISAENLPHYPYGGTSSSDSSSSDSSSDNTERDNRHEKETRDKAHADTYHPAPPTPPAGVVSPQPPPPPGGDR